MIDLPLKKPRPSGSGGQIKYLSKASKKELAGVAVLRLDFNTEDNWRMEATLPTLKMLLRDAQAVVILSHRGRPKVEVKNGEVKDGEVAQKFSLRKDAAFLSELLNKDVIFVPHFRFAEIQQAILVASKGSIFLLENIRFLKGEEEGDAFLAEKMASLGNYFVNDAFAVSHRAHASVSMIPKFLPAYAGLLLEKEIISLAKVLKKPERPLVLMIGGGKAHDKLEILRNFKNKADLFLLGGAPANTLLVLRGTEVGDSLADDDPKDVRLLSPFVKSRKVLIPVDWKMSQNRILDIGPATIKEYIRILKVAKTILWAGPMGYIEDENFAVGNLAVAKAIAKNKGAFSLTGGGETVAFLKKYKLDKKFSFISTGGGAMLDFLAGKKMPGIEALAKAKKINIKNK